MAPHSEGSTSQRWKRHFREASDPECQWTLDGLRGLLEAVDAEPTGHPRPPAADDRQDPTGPLIQAILQASQPMAAALGSTLHTLSAPGVFEDTLHLRLLEVYAHDAGVGAPHASRFDTFQRIMAEQRLTAHALRRSQLSDLQLPDGLFLAPAVFLALSRRPDLFAVELLGADQQLRTIGLLPPWAWLRDRGVPGEWERVDLRYSADGDSRSLDLSVTDIIDRADFDTARLGWGATLAVRLVEHWECELWRWAGQANDPRSAMVHLMGRRAREAAVYHEKSRLAGRTIQSWFHEARNDARGLVDALARSKYVVPGAPDKSILLTKLTKFGGPMFRVFSDPEDQGVIKLWIESLATDDKINAHDTPDTIDPAGLHSVRLAHHLDVKTDHGHSQGRPCGIRDAYLALQGRHCAPAVLEFAGDYVDYWLNLANNSIDRHPFPLPERVPGPGELREWLLSAHEDHASSIDLKENQRHLPSKAEVVDSTIQLAPLTLIDGSWLLGFTDLALATTRVGFSLFETYWDELGNGDIEINHPKLYRDVLNGMGVSLPPTNSQEFAESDLLREESFQLPVYWLSIGRFPQSRQAEVLGLNLAMELSGVGGSYRAARQAFKTYGFSTIFVDIHNTIDNVSTGHSAWAADAIESYLEAARAFGSSAADLEALWKRIRVGFASLDPDRAHTFPYEPSRFGNAVRRLGRGSTAKRRVQTFERTVTHNEPFGGPWRPEPAYSASLGPRSAV